MATQMKSFLDGPNRTMPTRFPEHEFRCPKCGITVLCTCLRAAQHKADEPFPYLSSTWCQTCRERNQDARYDPNDEMDQGGGVGGESTFGPYRERSYRR